MAALVAWDLIPAKMNPMRSLVARMDKPDLEWLNF